MTDTELIKHLRSNKVGTEIIIVDDAGNEYEITRIDQTIGGQIHQVIRLKMLPDDCKWFKTTKEKLDALNKYLDFCRTVDEKYSEDVVRFYKEEETKRVEHLIEYYNKKLSNEQIHDTTEQE